MVVTHSNLIAQKNEMDITLTGHIHIVSWYIPSKDNFFVCVFPLSSAVIEPGSAPRKSSQMSVDEFVSKRNNELID